MELYWFANRNQGTDTSEETPDFDKGPEYRSTIQTLIVYRNELARTLLPGRESAGRCTATIWSFPRVKVLPGVESGQS